MTDETPSEPTPEIPSAPAPPEPWHDLPDAELRQLAHDIEAGLVFTDRHVLNDRDLRIVFMPLMMLDEAAHARLDTAGGIYEYLNVAGPRSANGFPMFMSFRVYSAADAEKLWPLVTALRKQRETFRSVFGDAAPR